MSFVDPAAHRPAVEAAPLPQLLQAADTVLCLRQPGTPEVWFAGGIHAETASLRELKSLLTTHRAGRGCFAVTFEGRARFWLPEWTVTDRNSPTLDHRTQPADDLSEALSCSLDRREWSSAIARILEVISADEAGKIVLSQSVRLRGSFEPHAALAALLASARDNTVFCFQSHGVHWIGATPELLFRRVGRAVTADSLAGTQRNSPATPGFSEKELREQRLVTDFVARALQTVCSDVRSSSVQDRSADGLRHAHSIVQGTLRDHCDDDHLLQALHPTPAICGLPRDRALELIRALEKSPRDMYGGVLGWTDGDSTTAWVVLRCAKLERDAAHFFGGAGIVAGSSAEQEFQECRWKMESAARAVCGRTDFLHAS